MRSFRRSRPFAVVISYRNICSMDVQENQHLSSPGTIRFLYTPGVSLKQGRVRFCAETREACHH